MQNQPYVFVTNIDWVVFIFFNNSINTLRLWTCKAISRYVRINVAFMNVLQKFTGINVFYGREVMFEAKKLHY